MNRTLNPKPQTLYLVRRSENHDGLELVGSVAGCGSGFGIGDPESRV